MKNILMNVEMTKAILDGRKSRFSEVIKSEILDTDHLELKEKDGKLFLKATYSNGVFKEIKPQYQIGETISVKEKFRLLVEDTIDKTKCSVIQFKDGTKKEIGFTRRTIDLFDKWYPASFMNKEMARIFLKITNVRVEKLDDISEEDAIKEGIYVFGGGEIADTGDYFDVQYSAEAPFLTDDEMYYGNELFEFAGEAFEKIWNSTAPKGYKWEDNPYVFVYEFERVEK